jgi:hypothetical protein
MAEGTFKPTGIWTGVVAALAILSIVSANTTTRAQTAAQLTAPKQQCDALAGESRCGVGCTPGANAQCCDKYGHFCTSENCYFQAGGTYCCPRSKNVTAAGCQ